MIIPTPETKIIDEFWFTINDKAVPNIAPIFSISTWGRIYNSETKNILPKDMYYDKNHYITVRLKSIDQSPIVCQIHRVMMQSFFYIENSELYDVNHRDGIKYHNWIWNLEWMTHKENMIHAKENKLFRYGEDHANSKLTNEQAECICKLILDGKSPTEIASIMNLDCNVQKIVQNIKGGYSWKNLSKKYGITG